MPRPASARREARLLSRANQLVVLGVWTHPEPHDVAVALDGKGPVVQGQLELTRHAREVQGWVLRIPPQQLIGGPTG